jgi:hypothetical protein
MSASGALALAAALSIGLPIPAMAGSGDVLWVGMCDAAHPGTQIPIPLNRGGDQGPAKACHAACGTLPDRRARR